MRVARSSAHREGHVTRENTYRGTCGGGARAHEGQVHEGQIEEGVLTGSAEQLMPPHRGAPTMAARRSPLAARRSFTQGIRPGNPAAQMPESASRPPTFTKASRLLRNATGPAHPAATADTALDDLGAAMSRCTEGRSLGIPASRMPLAESTPRRLLAVAG